MIVSVGDVVLPGDTLGDIELDENQPDFVIGPGLRVHLNKVYAVKSGILKMDRSIYFVDCFHQKRYVPIRGETVLGIITNKLTDSFKVDLGSSEQASISYLAFEGATKRNRPNIEIGDAIFARLVTASKDMEPEVVCVDSYGKKGKLGILPSGGLIFNCSLNLIRKILQPNCPLLKILGKEMSHETAIGMNGKIWVKARNVQSTIAVCNMILASEHKSFEEIGEVCKDILRVLNC